MRNKSLQITAFQIDGHAHYANKGNDIVCAGVSSLSVTIINHLVGANVEETASGFVSAVNYPLSSSNLLLTQTLYDGLVEIANQYPNNVRVDDYGE